MPSREAARRWMERHPNYMREYKARRLASDPTYAERLRAEARERYRRKRPDMKPRKSQTEARHEYNVTIHHGITRTIRDWIYESQGRACAGCGVPYLDEQLDIDHNHGCCPGTWSCGQCIRGLVCRSCNVRDVLAGSPHIIFPVDDDLAA